MPQGVTITPDPPPLPAGYKLDPAMPPLPPGYTLDTKPARIDLSAGMVPRAGSGIDLSAGMVPKQGLKPDVFDQIHAERAGAGDVFDQIHAEAHPVTITPDQEPSLAEKFVSTIPGVGLVHRAAGAVQDWANEKMSPENPHMLSPAATFGTGVVRDAAGLVRSATSPAGLATTAATIAAPEVMGPALVGHGIYSAVKGWGDLKNPDVLQNELNAGAEAVGGAAVTGSAIRAGGGPMTQAIRQKISPSTQLPAQASQDLQNAIPPSKSAPYADIDMQKARPYLQAEHGNTPIDGVAGLREAADSAIGKIEDQISQKISQLPAARFKTNAIQDVTQALQASPRGQSFVNAGLKDLEDFQLDQPKTLAQADAIRRQLNAENKAVLAKNNYDVSTARATDPAFAAREAAAESLRDGIYNQLAANGMPNAGQLRLDEGSLIKVRNAAQNQIFNGDKVVQSTAQTGPLRRIGAGITKLAATGVGAEIAGPAGAIAGKTAGDIAARAFLPQALTRNELVERSFSKPVASPVPRSAPAPVSLPAAAVSSTAAQPNLSSPYGAMMGLRDLLVSGRTQ